MSLKSLKSAKVALSFAILGLVAVFLTNFYTGLMVFRHYEECDPLSSKRISASDQLLPYYIINIYEHVYTIAGIFVAGIFAASLGTVASALNSLSAVTCEDLLSIGMNIKITPEKTELYAKWMSLAYGVISFALVFIVERLGGVLQATLTLNGIVGGITLGLFLLGILSKRANTKGTFYGGIVALSVVIFIGIVSQSSNKELTVLPLSVKNCDCYVNETLPLAANMRKHAATASFSSWPIFQLSYMWYSMMGTLLTFLFGYIFSIITEKLQKRKLSKLNSARSIESDSGDVGLKTNIVRKVDRVLTSSKIMKSKTPRLNVMREKYINHIIQLENK